MAEANTQSTQPAKSSSSEKKTPFIKGLKAEFRKIIWPTKDDLVKQTTAVVVVTIILGIVIAIIDYALQIGIDKLVK